jgi:hypothetical protein
LPHLEAENREFANVCASHAVPLSRNGPPP